MTTQTTDRIDGLDLAEVDLFDPRWHRDGPPHALLARVRREAPVRWNPRPDGTGCWTVLAHADVAAASRDFETFSSWEGGVFLHPDQAASLDVMRNMLLFMDPPQHTQYRQILQRAFTPHAVRQLEGLVLNRCTRAIDAFVERGQADLVSEYAMPVPLGVICDLLGIPDEDIPMFLEWTEQMEESTRAAEPETAMGLLGEQMEYIVGLVARHQAEGRTDTILETLRGAEVDGRPINDLEIVVFFALLTFAGHDTTRNTTATGMLALLRHPDQLQEIIDDPGLVPAAVEEILRYTSVVHWFARTATRDTELGGVPIAKGDKVALWYTSASRDEALFDDPDRFDIHRDKPDHDAFGGGGRHFCLGSGLARLQLQVNLEQLTRRLRDLRLAGEAEYIESSWTHALTTLPVTFTPGTRAGD